jgi:hypothetical protein
MAWSGWQDLNLRPPASNADALLAELHPDTSLCSEPANPAITFERHLQTPVNAGTGPWS